MSHELRCWQREKKAAYLYRVLSDYESGTPRQLLFLELAHEADRQAELWRVEIRKSRAPEPSEFLPDRTLRWVAWLIKRMGPRPLAQVLRWFNLKGLAVYTDWLEGLPQPHQDIANKPASRIADWEGVLVNVHDGVLFLMALLIALAASGVETGTQMLLGIAGLMLGTISTSMSECFNIRYQRQTYRIAQQHFQALAGRPAAQLSPRLVSEMTAFYRSQGMSRQQAIDNLERQLAEDGLVEVETEAALLLPMPPPPMIWSAVKTGFGFLLGGLTVFVPLLFGTPRYPALVTFCVASPLSFVVGAMIADARHHEPLWGGLRSAGMSLLAAAISYFIGSELGLLFF